MVGPPRDERAPVVHPKLQRIPRAQRVAERARATLERFLRVEAVGGVALLLTAAAALIWANSPVSDSYHAFWHLPLSIGIGDLSVSKSLHFWINDGLMTIFFLVVGMEIRREIHEGALSTLDQATLPVLAAAGGVIVPALIYLSLNTDATNARGWAVPTATDIAFAVGILALLGRSIPSSVRVFLLALAIIDDVVAVLIIALFYTGGIQPLGLFVALLGILMVLGCQQIGLGTALAYVVPGSVVWAGLLLSGVHPTLAGVALGLLTPVRSMALREPPLESMSRVTNELRNGDAIAKSDAHRLEKPLRQLRVAHREILPPVVRVQAALHPWVAYFIMPLFALANAGVTLKGGDLTSGGASLVMAGAGVALVAGKPIGVVGATWLAVRLGLCRLAPGLTWSGVFLVGFLAGIGFTMSIFIAELGFADHPADLLMAKTGVLAASLLSGTLGFAWLWWLGRPGQTPA